MIAGIQVRPAHLPVRGGEPAVAGHLRALDLAARRPLGQVRQPTRVTLTGDQRLDHRPAGTPSRLAVAQTAGGIRSELIFSKTTLRLIGERTIIASTGMSTYADAIVAQAFVDHLAEVPSTHDSAP